MKRRPSLKLGDIVAWSNFAKKSWRGINSNDRFIVVEIKDGNDTTDGHTIIGIIENNGDTFFYAFRKELWFTGMNIKDYNMSIPNTTPKYNSAFEREKKIDNALSQSAIKDNDGRSNCFRCHTPTIEVDTGFLKKYNVCPKCKI